MLKTLKDRWQLFALVGVSTLSVGLVVALLKATDAFAPHSATVATRSPAAVESSVVLGLTQQPPEARSLALNEIAQKDKSVEGDRARYLLATDLINQGKGGSAIAVLDNLDSSYDELAPYILLKRGQAEAAAGQSAAAQATWNQLTTQYKGSAAAAEALYQLGQQSAPTNAYWNQLLSEAPSHPRSVEVALKQLQASAANSGAANSGAVDAKSAESTAPNELSLLKLVARYGLSRPEYVAMLDRLTSRYSSELTPDDWAAVGFGYWESQNYAKAGDAYSKAPDTPVSQYRAARGKENGGKVAEAIAAYQKLNQTFPDSPENATGLIKLANLVPAPAAVAVLDQALKRFPDKAPEALMQRAERLDALKSPGSAAQARASVLSQYSGSAAAAALRLNNAKESAKKGDIAGALDWTKQLVAAAPDDELAAEAGFWLGKWSLKQNQPEVARQAFEDVIRRHPESYFAWRSAVHLDWNVGDFDSVRSLNPPIVMPTKRRSLPTGSATLQELYLLGQDSEAWAQWQTEFVNQQSPTVAEQFTDGILRLGIGDNLNGIFMVSSLAWRDLPAEKSEYQQLKQDPSYWQAIYPFPYFETLTSWAQQRQLNPLLVTALVRQESRFQPDIRSVVGAVGLMQVMPETAEWIDEQLGKEGYNLEAPADNVKLGTWFLDFTHREYDNNSLFAVASYNAGPGSVSEWIAEGGFANADEFVEKIPYPETKGYISSVFGGYWNYLRLYDPEIAAKIAAL